MRNISSLSLTRTLYYTLTGSWLCLWPSGWELKHPVPWDCLLPPGHPEPRIQSCLRERPAAKTGEAEAKWTIGRGKGASEAKVVKTDTYKPLLMEKSCFYRGKSAIWTNVLKLFRQKYWDTPLNQWIQVYPSVPLPPVYKIKHLAMQSAFTNICERSRLPKELTELERGTGIGFHSCSKSVCEMSSLPRYSTINCKWYCKVEAFRNHSNSATKSADHVKFQSGIAEC